MECGGVFVRTGFVAPIVGCVIVVVLLVAGCGSDVSTQSRPPSSAIATGAAASTAAHASAPESTGRGAPVEALFNCLASNGVAAVDPAQSEPASQYPPDVADKAWRACRDLYLQVRPLPPQGDPLAYADCMATRGWVIAQPGFLGVVEDLEEYTLANDTCRAPVEGESADVSYCRFMNAIFDDAMHDPSMSITGVPNVGTDEARLEAAVNLYDEALDVAPEALVDDLQTLREGFRSSLESLRNGGPPVSFPDDAGERVGDHNLGVCGAQVYLGSLD